MRALFLFLLLIPPFGSVGGTLQVFGGGGPVTGRLWQVWSADYSFTSSSLAISYSPQPATTALQQFTTANLDFAAVDDALSSGVLQAYAGSGQLVQLPIIGNALAITYNLPNINATLVLNGTVLADIYLGLITAWDDPALVALNPSLGLPHVNITTAYGTNGTTFDDTSAFARALGSFSSEFAAAFSGMDALPPALDGRSVAFPDALARLSHVAGTPYSLAYVPLATLLINQTTAALPQALMWNRSGRLLNASTAGVQSAMLDAQSQFAVGNLTADISNGPGQDSWPLSFVSYIPFFVSRTMGTCAPSTEFVSLLQWALLNSKAGSDAATCGYAPLVPSYARYVLDSLNEFTCNSQPLLQEVAIFGEGPSYSVYTMWAMSYAEGNAVVEYSEATDDSQAVADLTGGYVDFALVKRYPALPYAGGDDRVVLPVAAFPYVPAYNVPDLPLSATLAFDLPTLADIYLGRIRAWNHENVSRLNPGITLPGQAIRVVYPNDSSSFSVETDALYQLLARVSPQFNASVSNASHTYSFVAALNTSIATNDVVGGLADVDFTFAVWPAVHLADAPQVGEGSVYRGSADAPLLLYSYDLSPVLSALVDFGSALVSSSPNASALYTLVLGPDESGWPLVGMGGMVFHTRTSEFCASAQALADFLWWTQSSNQAFNTALTNNAVVAGVVPQVRQAILQVLANATCQGMPTSSLYPCISGGMLCSNVGSCSSTGCQCNNGYSGTYCQDQSSGGGSNDTGLILAVVWASIGGCVIVFALALVVVMAVAQRVHKMQQGQGSLIIIEEPTPDIALDSIRIQGIEQVEAQRWNG